MEVQRIFQKRGQDWTSVEAEMVFQWFVHEELDRVIRFAYGFTQTLTAAEDAVQEGLTSAFRYLHSYDPQKYQGKRSRPFLNWLYTIVARESTRIMEKQRSELPWEEELDKHLSLSYSIEDLETTAELQSEIILHLGKLNPKYAEAIDLYIFQGKSHAEAAESSQWPCTARAMKVRKHRAIQELQQVLAEEGVL